MSVTGTISSAVSQIGNTASSALSQFGIGSSTTPVGTTANASGGSAAQAAGVIGAQTIAGNFDTFLQLLTTQLKNQNPLDPLDTNQFTQQLVAFASVEQQVNMNSNLQTLISLQQTNEATSAMQLVGATVTIKGTTATLSNASNSPAGWSVTASAPGTAHVTITSSTGQTALTGTMALNAGAQTFTWNGQGNNGVTWPDGSYTLSITATGANGQPVTVSTEVQGVVTGVDLSKTPAQLIVGGQDVPINQVQAITR